MEFEVEAPLPKRKTKWPRTLITIGVSTLLLIILFRHYKIMEVFTSFRSAITSGWILLVFCVSLFTDFFIAPEVWRQALQALGYRISFRVLLYLEMATDLVIQVLPMRSGELLKVWYLSKKHDVPMTTSTGSIVLTLGFEALALPLLALAGWIWILTGSLLVGIACTGAMVIVLLTVATPLGRLFLRILPEHSQGNESVRDKILSLVKNISGLSRRRLARICFYNLLFQFCKVMKVAMIFKAFSLEVEFSQILAYIPIISFFASLPISIGGLGIRESSLILAFHASVQAHSGALLGVGLTYTFFESILPAIVGIPLTAHLLARLPFKTT